MKAHLLYTEQRQSRLQSLRIQTLQQVHAQQALCRDDHITQSFHPLPIVGVSVTLQPQMHGQAVQGIPLRLQERRQWLKRHPLTMRIRTKRLHLFVWQINEYLQRCLPQAEGGTMRQKEDPSTVGLKGTMW